MTIRLGASPLSWMNADFPDVGADIAVEHCLSEIALAGYQGTELEPPLLQLGDKLLPALQIRDLACTSGWHSCELLVNTWQQELDRLNAHLDTLQSLGAKVAILAECGRSVHRQPVGLSHRPILKAAEWKTLCGLLEKAAKHCRQRGFRPVYHHHMGTVIQGSVDIARLMQGAPSLDLLLDTGHLAYAGEAWEPVYEAHAARVGHIHCKEVRYNKLQHHVKADSSFMTAVLDGVFTVPGDADPGHATDFEDLVDRLEIKGYDGWVIVEAEQDPNKANPFAYAKLGATTLSELLWPLESLPF